MLKRPGDLAELALAWRLARHQALAAANGPERIAATSKWMRLESEFTKELDQVLAHAFDQALAQSANSQKKH